MKRFIIQLITPVLQLLADGIILMLESDIPSDAKIMFIEYGVILDWYCTNELGIYLN